MRIVYVILSSIASGVLLGLSMPPVGYSILGWIALVPVLASVQRTRLIVGALAGLLTAITAAVLLALGWMPLPHPSEGAPNWIFGGYALFGVLLTAVCGTLSETKDLTFAKVALFAALAIVLEACLMVVLPVHLALSQYRLPAAMLLASATGIWGVSYTLWFTQFLLVRAIREPKGAVIPAACCIVLVLAGGLFLRPTAARSQSREIVAILQTSETDLPALSTLTTQAAHAGAGLVVWPELSSITIASRGNIADLKKLSAMPGEPAFVTTFEDDAAPKPHNTAAFFWKGQEIARYFKRKPFAGEMTVHAAGNKAVFAPWEVPVGLNVCFDACYPAIMHETADLASTPLIALPTEDPVSGGSVIQALHSAYTPFRAAELGVTVARADITAYSMIVGPDGLILGELQPGEGVLVRRVPAPRDTAYRHLGDWFLYLCVMATLGWIGSRILGSRLFRAKTVLPKP